MMNYDNDGHIVGARRRIKEKGGVCGAYTVRMCSSWADVRFSALTNSFILLYLFCLLTLL